MSDRGVPPSQVPTEELYEYYAASISSRGMSELYAPPTSLPDDPVGTTGTVVATTAAPAGSHQAGLSQAGPSQVDEAPAAMTGNLYPSPSSLPESQEGQSAEAPPPTEDEPAMLSHLDDLRRNLRMEIGHIESRISSRIEGLIFARTQELLAGRRYEERIGQIDNAVEALRIAVAKLQSVLESRTDSTTMSMERDHGKPHPVDEVGSASPARGSASTSGIAAQGHGGVAHPQRSPTEPSSRLEQEVVELRQALRMVYDRLGAEAIPPVAPEGYGSVPRQESTQEFTPPDEGAHLAGGPERVGEGIVPDTWLGPEYYGLKPMTTLQAAFGHAVSYRAYRLLRMHETVDDSEAAKVLKRANSIRGAFPHIKNFSGKHPARVITFLKQFKIACDLSGIHEGLAVRLVSFFLEGDAYSFYTTMTTAAFRKPGPNQRQLAWPVLVHRLLKRYCSEDVLAKAYEKVTRARQRDNEGEGEFADRIQESAIECGDVFDERTLVSYYVSGLLPTTRYHISEAVLHAGEEVDLSVVRRMAIAAGETHRAQLAVPRSGSRSKSSPRAMVLEPVDTVPYPTPIEDDRTPLMLLPAGSQAVEIDSTSTSTTSREGELRQSVQPTPSVPNHRDAPVVREPPPMTDDDASTALRVMTRNRGGYVCWGCREDGHDLYNCPYLSLQVRMLFAKANYDYQAEIRGSEVADQYYRFRSGSPRGRRGLHDARPAGRKQSVSFASPPVSSTRSPPRQTPGSSHPKAPRAVLVAEPGPSSLSQQDTEPAAPLVESSSSSSGN